MKFICLHRVNFGLQILFKKENFDRSPFMSGFTNVELEAVVLYRSATICYKFNTKYCFYNYTI